MIPSEQYPGYYTDADGMLYDSNMMPVSSVPENPIQKAYDARLAAIKAGITPQQLAALGVDPIQYYNTAAAWSDPAVVAAGRDPNGPAGDWGDMSYWTNPNLGPLMLMDSNQRAQLRSQQEPSDWEFLAPSLGLAAGLIGAGGFLGGAGLLGDAAAGGLYGLELGGAGVGAADLGLGYGAATAGAGTAALPEMAGLESWLGTDIATTTGAGNNMGAFDGLLNGYESLLGDTASNVASTVGDVATAAGDIATSPLASGGTLSDAYSALNGVDPFATTDLVNAGWNPLTGYGINSGYSSGMLDTLYNNIVSSGVSPTNALNAIRTLTGGAGTGAAGSGITGTSLFGAGLQGLASYLANQSNQQAAQTNANAQIEAARIAADAAKFKPVGVTTRFGESQFTKDAQGNVTGAGYTTAPDIAAMRESLLGAAPGMLSQFTGAQATTAPMGTAAQQVMSLGNQYLATSPQAQAQKYYDEQQAIMAAGRERELAALQNRLQQQGRLGLATGGTTTGMMAANPEMEAFYNAKRQQDLQLAGQATQGGMDYAKFGAGMVGTGGDLLSSMYRTQSAAYDPYKTAMGGAQMLEGLGQNALDLSIQMGKVASPAQSGALLAQGMKSAGDIMQPVNASNPWANLLGIAGTTVAGMQPQQQQPQQQQAWGFNPYTGQPLFG